MAGVGKKVKSIIERDKKVMLTTTRVPYPFVASHGDGDFAYDAEGTKYIDMSSFIATYNLGVNSNKLVRDAVKKQADRLMHAAFTDYYSELPVSFAEKLITMFPKGFGKVFFSNSGTEAIEASLKFARLFTKRQYTISFYGGFHGRTMGSLGLTASKPLHREHFGPFNSALHVPYAYCYRCPLKLTYPECGIACADSINKNTLARETSPKEVAAMFMEPVQGEGGYIVPPKEFVKEVRTIASDHGILFVSDEIQAGYMRTGKFLALDNFNVQADIYAMAKAVGGGLPLGVTVTRTDLGDIPSGSHANTFGGNHLAIAAADASLEYVKRNIRSLQVGIRRKNAVIMKRLNKMKDKYEIIGDVRGLGLMIGVELVKDRKTKEPAVEEAKQVITKCFEKGVLLMTAGFSTIRIAPPLTISEQSLEKALDVLEDAISFVDKAPRSPITSIT